MKLRILKNNQNVTDIKLILVEHPREYASHLVVFILVHCL